MDIRKIKKLIELLESSGIEEIEVREGEETVRIRRSGLVSSDAAPAAGQESAAPRQRSLPEPEKDKRSGTAPDASEEELPGHMVRSPIVGTFYRRPSPDADPFVEEGQKVAAGDILCIVEAMKMMNQIEADRSGVIGAILAQDGQPLEFDQPLMTILPAT